MSWCADCLWCLNRLSPPGFLISYSDLLVFVKISVSKIYKNLFALWKKSYRKHRNRRGGIGEHWLAVGQAFGSLVHALVLAITLVCFDSVVSSLFTAHLYSLEFLCLKVNDSPIRGGGIKWDGLTMRPIFLAAELHQDEHLRMTM